MSFRDQFPNHPRTCPGKPIRKRSGCKVYWLVFATRKEAEVASKWAETEAEIRYQMGYDSGYCTPGSITVVKDGYEVCIL